MNIRQTEATMRKVDLAVEFLAELLGAGPCDAVEVQRLADLEGIRPQTLRRASEAAPVEKRPVRDPETGVQKWVWELTATGAALERLRSDAFQLLSSLVLEDGRPWGTAAESFQIEDA